jgi:hypothetical protein
MCDIEYASKYINKMAENITIFYASKNEPYVIPYTPVNLRIACSAGVNRSATFRQMMIPHMHPLSIIPPQYGAEYADYQNKQITSFDVDEPDGFMELFGVPKTQNIQSICFEKIGYPRVKNFTYNHMDMTNIGHVNEYTEYITYNYWKTNGYLKNIYVLLNTDSNVISTVTKRLMESGESVDLVIIDVPDVIYTPSDPNIMSQSKEAYQKFYEMVDGNVIVEKI